VEASRTWAAEEGLDSRVKNQVGAPASQRLDSREEEVLALNSVGNWALALNNKEVAKQKSGLKKTYGRAVHSREKKCNCRKNQTPDVRRLERAPHRCNAASRGEVNSQPKEKAEEGRSSQHLMIKNLEKVLTDRALRLAEIPTMLAEALSRSLTRRRPKTALNSRPVPHHSNKVPMPRRIGKTRGSSAEMPRTAAAGVRLAHSTRCR
jgi:hypothetical protein